MRSKSPAILPRFVAGVVFGALAAASGLSSGAATADAPGVAQASDRAQGFPAKPVQRSDLVAPFGVEVVVKFKDDGKVKDIIDAFWKNPKSAKDRFNIFKRNHPEMSDATLDHVTYSNELVLIYPCIAMSRSERAAETREIVGRLTASSDIAYAELDMTFEPQE